MTASAPFTPGSGWLPGRPLPGGRDHDRRVVRQERRQALRQLGADARMGLRPALPLAWLEPEAATEPGGGNVQRRRPRPRRVLTLTLVAALGLAVVVPGVVDSAEPAPDPLPAAEEVVPVLTDDAGRRLDRGNVREVEIGIDGTVWLAVGKRVLALDRPGATEPRTRGWEALPRRLAVAPDGALWAVEDGGTSIVLADGGWVRRTPESIEADDPSALDEAALEQLRDAGIERAPRVLADATGPGGVRWLVVDVSPRPDQTPVEYRLLRGDGRGWSVLGPAEGLRDTRTAWTTPGPQAPVALTVDDHGRAWFSLGADGLWLADGEAIARVRFPGLGSGALDLAGTPDGSVWIASTRGGLFRWSPEARAAL